MVRNLMCGVPAIDRESVSKRIILFVNPPQSGFGYGLSSFAQQPESHGIQCVQITCLLDEAG